MKLRMRGATVRLRLTQSEVAQFARTGLVEEAVPFPSGTLRYRLLRSSAMAADFAQGTLTVSVPPDASHEWTESAQVGMAGQVNGLEILIEKDFQCAHGPTDFDAFPPDRQEQ